MILAIDGGLATLGWALVEPRTGRLHGLGSRIARSRARPGTKNEDRLIRLDGHARFLLELSREHGVRRIVGEAPSLPRRGGVDVHASAFLAWGLLVGLAAGLGVRRPDAYAPAVWQRAIVPRALERRRGGYALVETRLDEYVRAQDAAVVAALEAIPRSQRNHALDAVGVGVFAALRPLGS